MRLSRDLHFGARVSPGRDQRRGTGARRCGHTGRPGFSQSDAENVSPPGGVFTEVKSPTVRELVLVKRTAPRRHTRRDTEAGRHADAVALDKRKERLARPRLRSSSCAQRASRIMVAKALNAEGATNGELCSGSGRHTRVIGDLSLKQHSEAFARAIPRLRRASPRPIRHRRLRPSHRRLARVELAAHGLRPRRGGAGDLRPVRRYPNGTDPSQRSRDASVVATAPQGEVALGASRGRRSDRAGRGPRLSPATARPSPPSNTNHKKNFERRVRLDARG